MFVQVFCFLFHIIITVPPYFAWIVDHNIYDMVINDPSEIGRERTRERERERERERVRESGRE